MTDGEQARFNTAAALAVDAAMISELKRRALESPTRRFRLCLHHSTREAVQQMIVVHCHDNYSRPHAHTVPLSYLVLEGSLRVLLFDDSGAITGHVDLEPLGQEHPFALRLEPGQWYMPVCRTPQVVFFETKAGPFERDATNRWAPWSPDDTDSAAIAAFRAKLGITT